MSTSSEAEDLKCFDFVGESFEAGAVLRDREKALKRLPCPNAKTFNNLNEYSNKTFKKTATVSQCRQPLPERKFTAEQVAATVRPEPVVREVPTVLSRMRSQTGPLQLLTRSIGLRIRVRIRRRKAGPPGSQFACLTGQLVAFDKHFNLILSDVDEHIRFRLMSHQQSDVTEQSMRQTDRHHSRLFVRGDSVVIVSLL